MQSRVPARHAALAREQSHLLDLLLYPYICVFLSRSRCTQNLYTVRVQTLAADAPHRVEGRCKL